MFDCTKNDHLVASKQAKIKAAMAAYKYAREQARARDGISDNPLFVVYSYGNPWTLLMDRAGQQMQEAQRA